MASFSERVQAILQGIAVGQTNLPGRLIISHSHVDDGTQVEAFVSNEHYFQVRINEMFLAAGRKWFVDYHPMVFVVSQFNYGFGANSKTEVPFVVGPSMLEKYKMPIPGGTVFSNTKVAGLHPYRGGSINLSVFLYKVSEKDYARQLLQFTENVASVLDFSTSLSIYLKVAGVVLDGVESLLGLTGTIPVAGWSQGMDPDANDVLEPRYFALINQPESDVDPNAFWVDSNRRLLKGSTRAGAKPFREADYILYSMVQTKERNDIAQMPFYDLYQQMRVNAGSNNRSDYKLAQITMSMLKQRLILSPDLTEPQSEKLQKKYTDEMVRKHEEAIATTQRGAESEQAPDELHRKLRETIKILDL